ncbi:putative mitochondrial protein AtMg00310 [Apium graveolens]|uniref:putative mitochondrial protein AtMg00310 n=1 Tax=Apium graveolens TaxID=4045 RepID=UPI003D7B2F5C
MAKFFWGDAGTKKKIHWRNWEVMCKAKCVGGMGFKDLKIFNDALLGKQAWRLVQQENSLLGRVMKAKYYHNCTFLESALGYSCSYSWKSIWSSKALLKEGLTWRVGNGSKINIWTDPWLADENGRYVMSDPVEDLNLVSELIDHDDKE